MMVGDWLSTGASLVEAIAVSIASFAAWRGLNAWRYEMVSRRRAELAEDTLAMFYQVRDHLRWVRTPGSLGGEGETRVAETAEEDDTKRERDAYFWPIERIHREAELWSRFEAARYRFHAVFGGEAAQPFDTLRTVRIRIETSARSLIRISGHWRSGLEPRGHRERKDRLEADIGWGADEDDKIAVEVDSAVKAIECTCRAAIIGGVVRQWNLLFLGKLRS